MDSAALLDLLGNRNRRRILRLLSRKPCYVTEISDYLGVSPKAVIDHLRKLEDAGLIESSVDDRRRKYFRIARNVRLEVNVSPYGFGAKSAYAASKSLDLTSCRHISLDVDPEDGEDPSELATELEDLEELQNELSLAQRWVQGRITDVLDSITDRVDDEDIDGRLYVDVLLALANEELGTADLARRVEAPEGIVGTALARLAETGVVESTDEGWRLV